MSAESQQISQEEKHMQEDSPVDFTVTHPLHSPWTLWYDNPKKKTKNTYGNHLKQVYTIRTVEDFWSVFNYINRPSELPLGSNYHLFREGIEPTWEDPMNANGGAWTAPIGQARELIAKLDDIWLDAALACVGEHFDTGDDVCGLVVSVRANNKDRLQLWTKNAEEESVVRIGTQWKEAMNLPHSFSIKYLLHEDSANSRAVNKTKAAINL